MLVNQVARIGFKFSMGGWCLRGNFGMLQSILQSKWKLCAFSHMVIDREAREIIELVASIRLSVRLSVSMRSHG